MIDSALAVLRSIKTAPDRPAVSTDGGGGTTARFILGYPAGNVIVEYPALVGLKDAGREFNGLLDLIRDAAPGSFR
jgi:hypothetical protein